MLRSGGGGVGVMSGRVDVLVKKSQTESWILFWEIVGEYLSFMIFFDMECEGAKLGLWSDHLLFPYTRRQIV